LKAKTIGFANDSDVAFESKKLRMTPKMMKR
jgi:hypothetical protein